MPEQFILHICVHGGVGTQSASVRISKGTNSASVQNKLRCPWRRPLRRNIGRVFNPFTSHEMESCEYSALRQFKKSPFIPMASSLFQSKGRFTESYA